MSGPLASWVAEHSKADAHGRAVLVQLALAARHDGTPAHPPTWDDLARRTGLHRGTVAKRLADLRRLGEVLVEEGGGGRGRAASYHVVFAFCPEAACWSCGILAGVLKKPGTVGPVAHPKGSPTATVSGRGNPKKGSRSARKGSRSGAKGSPTATHNGTGDGTPPQGGTVTHPESAATRSRRPSADAAAAPAQASEEPFNRMLPWLDQIRRYDPKAQLLYGSSPLCYRLSPEWARRGGEATLLMDEEPVAKWLAWAAEQVAAEQKQMQAASRHRLADPVPVADVLDELGQQRETAS